MVKFYRVKRVVTSSTLASNPAQFDKVHNSYFHINVVIQPQVLSQQVLGIKIYNVWFHK